MIRISRWQTRSAYCDGGFTSVRSVRADPTNRGLIPRRLDARRLDLGPCAIHSEAPAMSAPRDAPSPSRNLRLAHAQEGRTDILAPPAIFETSSFASSFSKS